MPFGFTNASIVFQCFINDIFYNLLNIYILFYLDNILIYYNDMTNYTKYIKEVFCHLQKTGLYAKAKKYKFHSEAVEYLKYILFLSELTIANDKIEIIQDWPKLRKVKDFQSFLIFVNFYCKFIYEYLDIVISHTYLV